jgi:hypothetical protein
MKNFCIRAKGNDEADSYWISAVSKEEARRLVALNIIGAAGVGDPAKFECVLDDTKTPPMGFIHRRLNGPVAIERI